MTEMLMAPAPDRSLEQRLAALERANAIRSIRKVVKAEVKTQRRPVVELLLDPGADLETMKVFELLLATPKVGRVKANKWLSMARISPSKTLGGMTSRQRAELAAVMGKFGRPRSVV